jgi:hypothetical protein
MRWNGQIQPSNRTDITTGASTSVKTRRLRRVQRQTCRMPMSRQQAGATKGANEISELVSCVGRR